MRRRDGYSTVRLVDQPAIQPGETTPGFQVSRRWKKSRSAERVSKEWVKKQRLEPAVHTMISLFDDFRAEGEERKWRRSYASVERRVV